MKFAPKTYSKLADFFQKSKLRQDKFRVGIAIIVQCQSESEMDIFISPSLSLSLSLRAFRLNIQGAFTENRTAVLFLSIDSDIFISRSISPDSVICF